MYLQSNLGLGHNFPLPQKTYRQLIQDAPIFLQNQHSLLNHGLASQNNLALL